MKDESIVRTSSNVGIIWSSARLVRGLLKWINERNPYRVLYVSHETAAVTQRKVGTTSSQRGPLMPWATHMIQWTRQRVAKPRGGANPIKLVLSSDRRLQLASLKLELLVIADQHAAVNTFSKFALTMKAPGRWRFQMVQVHPSTIAVERSRRLVPTP